MKKNISVAVQTQFEGKKQKASSIFFRLFPQTGNPDNIPLKQRFQNPVPTFMEMSPLKMLRILIKFLRGNKYGQPESGLKTQSFAAADFNLSAQDKPSLVWFGHSSLLLGLNGKIILIDPVFSKRASLFSFMGPKQFPYENNYSVEDMPEPDIVLLTHDHYDHLDYQTILKLRETRARFFVPRGVEAHLLAWGIEDSRLSVFSWWQETVEIGLGFVFVPSRHFSGRKFNDRFSALWGGWVVRSDSHSFYFGGDSGYFPGFEEIGKRYGPFDFAALECGQYNEDWHDIHMMPEETVQAAIDTRSVKFMPVHWGKFKLALHSWDDPVKRVTSEAKRLSVNVVVPEIGEIFNPLEYNLISDWWLR